MKELQRQTDLYSKEWDNCLWNGEKLFPVLLTQEEILNGAMVSLHVPTKPSKYNIFGTPRCGTKWLQKIIVSLLNKPQNNLWLKVKNKLLVNGSDIVNHFHEGLIEDFSQNQKVIFIYRDIRDAIVSGYFYIKNELHGGSMGSTTEVFNSLSQEEGLKRHIIMYMKYRMPVMNYWFNQNSPNLTKVKYEDLLYDREKWIRYLNKQTGINAVEKIIINTVNKTSFQKMSGRKDGEENSKSHQRKGISGDWKNQFTNEHIEIFNQMGGEEFLVKLGYKI